MYLWNLPQFMLKTSDAFYKQLLQKFPFSPTEKQNEMLQLLCHFSFSNEKDDLFLLKGYAGTGKTTTIGTFVNNLWTIGKKAVLLAPTGRAAKVISGYSKRPAYTIHKKIYFPKKLANGGVDFVLQTNKHKNTFFIVVGKNKSYLKQVHY
jgi:ABC-type proline/glycine betaine transport system ATPase subunit